MAGLRAAVNRVAARRRCRFGVTGCRRVSQGVNIGSTRRHVDMYRCHGGVLTACTWCISHCDTGSCGSYPARAAKLTARLEMGSWPAAAARPSARTHAARASAAPPPRERARQAPAAMQRLFPRRTQCGEVECKSPASPTPAQVRCIHLGREGGWRGAHGQLGTPHLGRHVHICHCRRLALQLERATCSSLTAFVCEGQGVAAVVTSSTQALHRARSQSSSQSSSQTLRRRYDSATTPSRAPLVFLRACLRENATISS